MKKNVENLLIKVKHYLSLKIPENESENIWLYLRRKAAQETADYVQKNMLTLPHFNNRLQLLEFSLSKVEMEGLYLEVESGWQDQAINLFAKRFKKTSPRLNNFENLPESWSENPEQKKLFLNGQFPKFENNVQLYLDDFDETVSEVTATHEEKIAFLQIGCDVYSSTKIIFELLQNRIVSGTVIQFNKYFNYPGWKNHQYKAFQEFINQSHFNYQYLGYCNYGHTVSVIIDF